MPNKFALTKFTAFITMTDQAPERLANLLASIDACNRHDPQLESEHNSQPKALLYGQRMSAALAKFAPDAGEYLQIAARAQHIERWRIPRDDYPRDRAGYLRWRKELGQFHARRTGELMGRHGYSQADSDRVGALLTKRQLKQDSEVQTLEDVICLVFIQYYLQDFAQSQPADKLPNIIRKTWAKMSDRGHQQALTLSLAPDLQATLEAALASN